MRKYIAPKIKAMKISGVNAAAPPPFLSAARTATREYSIEKSTNQDVEACQQATGEYTGSERQHPGTDVRPRRRAPIGGTRRTVQLRSRGGCGASAPASRRRCGC